MFPMFQCSVSMDGQYGLLSRRWYAVDQGLSLLWKFSLGRLLVVIITDDS